MKARSLKILGLSLAVAAWGGVVASLQVDGFPHRLHQGLFPLCQSCHRGIETGTDAVYPDPERCAACHDGERERRVDWSVPEPTVTNLDFSHGAHRSRAASAGDTVPCRACHGVPRVTASMAVQRATPESCLECHAHGADTHLAPTRDCTACHRAVADVEDLSLERIRRFPAPPSHAREDFLSTHAPSTLQAGVNCATCHARETCARCHLNADQLPAVQAMDPDSRVAVLEAGRPPAYPEPASHTVFEWSWSHGQAAAQQGSYCANCHARESCEACHGDPPPDAVAALSRRVAGGPTGVEGDPTARVHDPGFVTSHGAPAALDGGSCGTCHTTSFCESCHDGPDRPAFHYADYLQTHGAEAWGSEFECSTCHNPDVFCRGCHQGIGRGSEGRLDVAYHSRRPFWLFGHGTAARQGLESCRTCHAQSDCMVCHGAVGAWRINPHGPGFAADRLRDADALSCRACHRRGIPPS